MFDNSSTLCGDTFALGLSLIILLPHSRPPNFQGAVVPDGVQVTEETHAAATALAAERTARRAPERSGPAVARIKSAITEAAGACPFARLRSLLAPGPAVWRARDAAVAPDPPSAWVPEWRAALALARAEAEVAAEQEAAARTIPLLISALPLLKAAAGRASGGGGGCVGEGGGRGAWLSRSMPQAHDAAYAASEADKAAFAAVCCVGRWGQLVARRRTAAKKAAEAAAAADA